MAKWEDFKDSKECKIWKAVRDGTYTIAIDGEIYPKSVLNIHNKSIDIKCLVKSATVTKQILIWNHFFGITFDKATCPLKNCEFSRDRAKVEEADLVLVRYVK